MPEVDTELASALKQAKTKPMFFAFVANGSAGKLLVDKKKIEAKDAEAAKKECAGGQVYRGRCTFVDNIMVFQVPKAAPPSLAALTKKIIKSDAGLTFDVVYRVADDLEEEGKPTSGEEQPTDVPTPEAHPAAARFAARLKALPPVLQKLEAVHKDLATQAKTHVAEGNKAYVAKKYDEANAALDKAEALIKQGLTTAGSGHPEGPKTGETEPHGMKRLNALTPAIKAALSAGGPNVARIQSLSSTAAMLLKNNDVAGADKALDELEPLVKPSGGQQPKAPSPAALAAWQAARELVVKQIRVASVKMEATKDPTAIPAVIQLKSIIAQLTPNPATPKQVAELENYLRNDDVIDAAETIPPEFGGPSIREPLLAAVEQLKA